MSLLDADIRTVAGESTTLEALADGRAALLVNIASDSSLTGQFAALEALQLEFRDRLAVVGFPCNQFLGQEPGGAEENAEFWSTTYGVTFPLTEKIEVNGDDRHPLFAELAAVPDATGYVGDVRSDFEKWLVGPDGAVLARFAPTTPPDAPELRDAVASIPLVVHSPPKRGDSAYMLVISNDTMMPTTIKNTGSGCTDWDRTPTGVTLQPKQATAYYYHRASHCHGENGQVYFSFASQRLDGSAMPVGTIASDFTADHEQNCSVTHAGSQFSAWTFDAHHSGDQDLLTVHLYDGRQIDIPTALSLGFIGHDAMKKAVADLANLGDVGSSTQRAISTYGAGFDVTKYLVTTTIWGFRTLKDEVFESSWLKAGVMPSYALKDLQGSGLATFWVRNGPQVSDATGAIALGMRLLAVSSSSVPRSQFASVGLDFATAANENWHTPGQNVYAFQVIPNAPVQGVNSEPGKTGETQVQILGGTPTNGLYRSTDGLSWFEWSREAADWVSTSFVPSNGLDMASPSVP